jgi:hypothetical protein
LSTARKDIGTKKQFIFSELENCGNVKFDQSNNTEAWYKSCYDLMMSRFCVTDYVKRNINSIKIKRVIKVTNRALLAKFEESLLNDVDENDYINNKFDFFYFGRDASNQNNFELL